jgi:hypothetical protein
MTLTNAEKQQRWRDRNQVVLTDRPEDIALKLMDMPDQAKLKKIARYINDHLKHPDRNREERLIAVGRIVTPSLNGPLGVKAAIKARREPKPQGSWRVEPLTRDGRRWTNGVRLATKAEAETYVEGYIRYDMAAAGYVTAEIPAG